MRKDFPRILLLLRQERGLTQKIAAEDLDVSQAMLSHYEKGARECGLDFVVRAASYYDVSCDYMLGLTPHRDGSKASYGPAASQTLINNCIDLIFAILEDIDVDSLTLEFSSYLSAGVYKIFRVLYTSNENPTGLLSLNPYLASALLDSKMVLSEAQCRYILDEIKDLYGAESEMLPLLSPAIISAAYPQFSFSLFELIRSVEDSNRSP